MITIKPGLQAIFWDFDGVLMDSNPVRNMGFEKVLADYPAEQVEALLSFHRANGGLSRYVKFRYFFEEIRQEKISDDEILIWAEKFSAIMREMLLNTNLLIDETLTWVKENNGILPMHIVSGSDQQELRFLCEYHGINHYFKDINGSPTPKKKLVADLLKKYNYNGGDCVLIGDAYNDFEAADVNDLKFFPYNNPSIMKYKTY